MELKRGYKETEVGIIPVDWEVKYLSSIATQITDGDHLTPKRSKSGYFLLSARNVRDGRIDLSDVDYVESEEFNRMRLRCAPQSGDILISCSGHGLGRVSLVPENLPCVLVRSAALVKLNSNTNSSFIHYWLRSSFAQKQIGIQLSRAAQPNLFINNIEKLHTVLPPTKAEQEAIAEALSDADAVIESLEQLIAKKRQLKQGAMQELLTGKKRLPGFSGEWEMKRLGDNIDLLTGFPFPSHAYAENGIRLLRGSNVKRGVTDWNEDITQYWPQVTTNIKEYVLQTGDIVIAMDGSLVGRSFAQLTESDLPALLLQRVARIRSNTIDMGFLKEHVCCERFTEYCDSVKTVTAIPHISPKDIKSFSIPVAPTLAEQTAIATILSDMNTEIATLETKLAKVRQIKQGMMQELLTGRIRLV